MFSPAIFGTLILVSLFIEDIGYFDTLMFEYFLPYLFHLATIILFGVSGIGLFRHKIWGKTLAAIALGLLLIALVVFSFIILLDPEEVDKAFSIGILLTFIVASIGGLLLLFNTKVEEELYAKQQSPLMDDILDLE